MTLILIGGGTGVYFGERYSLDRSLRRDLAGQADEVRRLVGQPGAITSQDLKDRRDSYIQVLDPAGADIAATPQLQDRRFLRADQLSVARRGVHTFQRGSLTRLNSHSFRIRTEAVNEGGSRRIIVVAARRDSRDEALRELIAQLVGFGVIAIALSAIAGYRFTRAAMRPVEGLRQQADVLYRGDAIGNLDVPASGDEIAALAVTFNRLLDRIRQSVERERAFSGAASHELRTPLTALKAELDLALIAPRDHEELLSAIRCASADTTRLIRLAEDLLLLRTPEVGVPDTVHSMRTIIADAVGQREVLVAMSPAAETARIAGSDELLSRAIQNLLDNADRHGQAPISLDVSLDDGNVILDVADSGAGFPKDLIDSVFEPFRRGPQNPSGTGSGLGLAIVEAVLRAHGGTAVVVDGPRSVVRLGIPVVDSDH